MIDNKEKDIIQSIESGEWGLIPDYDYMKIRLMSAVAETALKNYRINVRITKRDVEALKTIALEEGIPY